MWVLFGILVISAWVFCSAILARAETLNFKFFSHVTHWEVFPVGDIEGHNVSINVREGTVIFASGELAWMKAINYMDVVKGANTFDQYYTVTFQDGSRITCHNKGRSEVTPAGASTTGKWAGEIINGTGRFQGIKGTAAARIKFLPLEKGEKGNTGKALAEGIFDYTLPSK
jgi:hypothetical protein